MVYEARGEKGKAAEPYRKACRFALSHEGFDQDAADGFLSEANRLEPHNNLEKKKLPLASRLQRREDAVR
jgi:hypothetical protein